MSISDTLLEQTEQYLKNIESALRQAGSSLKDVVRVTCVLPNGADFEQCWPVLRTYFGEVRPAAMMISAGLADPRIKIEIEVTARKRSYVWVVSLNETPNPSIERTSHGKPQPAGHVKRIKK